MKTFIRALLGIALALATLSLAPSPADAAPGAAERVLLVADVAHRDCHGTVTLSQFGSTGYMQFSNRDSNCSGRSGVRVEVWKHGGVHSPPAGCSFNNRTDPNLWGCSGTFFNPGFEVTSAVSNSTAIGGYLNICSVMYGCDYRHISAF